VESLLRQTAAGTGELVLIAGPPGIGKTAVLQAARQIGRELGIESLCASASALEADVAFGVARQLFEPALLAAPQPVRDALLKGIAGTAVAQLELLAPSTARGGEAKLPNARTPVDTIVRGLYWLTAGLADFSPLLIGVDDVQCCDAPSWRFLAYLARRLEDLPVALIAVAQASEAEAPRLSLPELEPACEILTPAPLSRPATGELLRRTLADPPEQGFCDACYSVTGGNPFLLTELIPLLRTDHIALTAAEAERVKRLLPVGVARAVIARLQRLPEHASAAAQAIAVLGAGAQLRWLMAIAGLTERAASEAVDALGAASLLRHHGGRIEFAHPLTQSAVYDSIPPARRSLMHAEAARLLQREGAPLDRVASHLILAPPAGDRGTTETLIRAASVAESRGAPEVAARYLERALAEPGPHDLRGWIMIGLARAQIRLGNPLGLENLSRARDASRAPGERASLALEIGRAMVLVDRSAEALELFRAARTELGGADAELDALLEAEHAGVGLLDITTAQAAIRELSHAADVRGETLGERLLLAYRAYLAAARGASSSLGADLARRALAADDLLSEQTMTAFCFAVTTLADIDLYEEALAALEKALGRARDRGSTLMFVLVSWLRARVQYRRGRLDEAEADARGALAVESWFTAPVAFLGDVLIERGEHDLAEAEFARRGLTAEELFPNLLLANQLLHTRGRLRCAQGRWRQGLADFLAVGERLAAWEIANPASFPWRSSAALAYAALGNAKAASRLSDEELSLARAFGASRALGIALRVAGLVEKPAARTDLLAEAVLVLEHSGSDLEHGRALVDYGAALRRGGRRGEARQVLRRGLDLTSRCGASALVLRARDELIAAGARPRRERISGADALTASERRVAAMAAEGMTNREIAQALFITIRTVKAHLGHIFTKLDVSSRGELGAALVTDTGRAVARADSPSEASVA
jgi:DNA-binding CsgD family transcriptional regulator